MIRGTHLCESEKAQKKLWVVSLCAPSALQPHRRGNRQNSSVYYLTADGELWVFTLLSVFVLIFTFVELCCFLQLLQSFDESICKVKCNVEYLHYLYETNKRVLIVIISPLHRIALLSPRASAVPELMFSTSRCLTFFSTETHKIFVCNIV